MKKLIGRRGSLSFYRHGAHNAGSNDLSAIAPVLLMRGALLLKKQLMMPRLAMFDVKSEMAKQFETINVEIPNTIPVQDVTVATPNTPTGVVPTVIPITLDYWKEACFSLSDKDITQISANTLPLSAEQAIYSLANAVDVQLLAEYKKIYNYVGAAGTTPDALEDIVNTMKVLNENAVPFSQRALLIDPTAHAKFSLLSDFINANKVGDDGTALKEASLGRKFMFDIFMDQNMPLHTKGTIAASGGIASKTTVAAGLKTAVLNDVSGGTLTGTLVVGDIITFANQTQSYVITELATASDNEITAKFEPALTTALADGTLVTVLGSHRVNLGFHSQAFCFASRQLSEQGNQLGQIVMSVVDADTGVTLRLEIKRIHKAVQYSYDILFGTKCIYPERAVRLIG